MYSPAPIFADFDEAPDEEQRFFLNNIVELVAPSSKRPILIPDLPPSAEISLMTLDGMWVPSHPKGRGDSATRIERFGSNAAARF